MTPQDDPFQTHGQKDGGENSSPFVKIGPDAAKGQVTHCRGKLLAIRESQKYPGSLLYDMVGPGGNRFTLVGFFAVNDKIKTHHIGDAFDITYEGMVTTKSKKTAKQVTIIRLPAKDIPEDMFPEEPEDDTDSFPVTSASARPMGSGGSQRPPEPDDNDDELPF